MTSADGVKRESMTSSGRSACGGTSSGRWRRHTSSITSRASFSSWDPSSTCRPLSGRTRVSPSRVHLPTCPLAHLPTCPPAHLPTCPPAHLPTCPPAHLPGLRFAEPAPGANALARVLRQRAASACCVSVLRSLP
eukprot:1047669-Prorocentrum_minimum.AAC.1